MTYEELVDLAECAGATVLDGILPNSNLKGICINDVIIIDKSVTTEAERVSILHEELSHYLNNTGNILDQLNLSSQKQEKLARNRAYEKVVTFDSIIEAFDQCLQNREEFANMIGVTEEFLQEAIWHYVDKYGQMVKYGEFYIFFEPLGVFKRI